MTNIIDITKSSSYLELLFDSVMTHLEKGDSVLLEDRKTPLYPVNIYALTPYTGLNAVSILQSLKERKISLPYVAYSDSSIVFGAKIKNPSENGGIRVKSLATIFSNSGHSFRYASVYSAEDAVQIAGDITDSLYHPINTLPLVPPELSGARFATSYEAFDDSIDERAAEFLCPCFHAFYTGGKSEKGNPELFSEMRKAYTGNAYRFIQVASKADYYAKTTVYSRIN